MRAVKGVLGVVGFLSFVFTGAALDGMIYGELTELRGTIQALIFFLVFVLCATIYVKLEENNK